MSVVLDSKGRPISSKQPVTVARKRVKPEKPTEHSEIENFLLAHGFADLNDPALIHQLAFHVKDHEHFREIILATGIEERHNCYEAMAPYLRFKAKPYYEYLIV